MNKTNNTKNTFAPTFCASGKGQDMLVQSTSSIDTATTASSSTTSPSSTENDKHNIDDTNCLVNALISVPTQNNSSTFPTFTFTFTCAQHQTQPVDMETDEIDEESEVISNTMDAMNLQEDNNEVNAEPDLFEQSLTKLLKPRKKERHHFSIAEDILRDLGEEDGEW